MSALFDGHEIWHDFKAETPTLTKEQQEKWDRIQAHCAKVAKDMVDYSEAIYEEESVGC
jgi:hypothetical protein